MPSMQPAHSYFTVIQEEVSSDQFENDKNHKHSRSTHHDIHIAAMRSILSAMSSSGIVHHMWLIWRRGDDSRRSYSHRVVSCKRSGNKRRGNRCKCRSSLFACLIRHGRMPTCMSNRMKSKMWRAVVADVWRTTGYEYVGKKLDRGLIDRRGRSNVGVGSESVALVNRADSVCRRERRYPGEGSSSSFEGKAFAFPFFVVVVVKLSFRVAVRLAQM